MPVDWKCCNSGYELSRKGQIEKALAVISGLMQGAESNRDQAVLAAAQACCYSNVGEIDKSLILLTQARTLADGHRDLLSQIALMEASAHALRSEHTLACSKFASIKSDYADLLQEDDGFAIELHSRFGCALVGASRFDEAIPMLRTLLEREELEDRQRIQLYLGIALAWTGHSDEAQQCYLQAAKGEDASLAQTALEYASPNQTSQ